jgi:hypothetical protein
MVKKLSKDLMGKYIMKPNVRYGACTMDMILPNVVSQFEM